LDWHVSVQAAQRAICSEETRREPDVVAVERIRELEEEEEEEEEEDEADWPRQPHHDPQA